MPRLTSLLKKVTLKNYLVATLCALGLALAAPASFAQEPRNLAADKNIVKRYHDSGEYMKDFTKVTDSAMQYLKSRIKQGASNGKKLAVVFDIDETTLSNYPNLVKLDFGGTIEDIRAQEDACIDEALKPALALYQYAKAHNVAIIFITGRLDTERDCTIRNLKKTGYLEWDKLIFREGKFKKLPAAVYKTEMRKRLSAEGYQIILNIGDQDSDLRGDYAEKTFKLPNPFYLIP